MHYYFRPILILVQISRYIIIGINFELSGVFTDKVIVVQSQNKRSKVIGMMYIFYLWYCYIFINVLELRICSIASRMCNQPSSGAGHNVYACPRCYAIRT